MKTEDTHEKEVIENSLTRKYERRQFIKIESGLLMKDLVKQKLVC